MDTGGCGELPERQRSLRVLAKPRIGVKKRPSEMQPNPVFYHHCADCAAWTVTNGRGTALGSFGPRGCRLAIDLRGSGEMTRNVKASDARRIADGAARLPPTACATRASRAKGPGGGFWNGFRLTLAYGERGARCGKQLF